MIRSAMEPADAASLVRREIAGVAIADLVREHGTPLYVYDAETIRRRCRDLAAWDTVRFAQKACSNLAVLDLVRRAGVVVDAVSAGEIHRALAAGYPAHAEPGAATADTLPPVHPIVYTADIFDRASLDAVVRHGIHVNCGSADMLEQLAERMPGAAVTLRVNPGFGHGHSQKTNTGGEGSKHGIWHEEIPEVLRRAEWAGLSVTGLHMHIGSGADLAHLGEVAGALERVAREIGRSLTTISAGGGLPVAYQAGEEEADLAGYYSLWDATRRRLEEAFGHRLRLEIEPGRFLTAEAGFLITEVRAIKRQGSRKYLLVDAGFNTLARPVLYGSYHPMSLCPFAEAAIEACEEVAVGGPLCESGDIFTQAEGGFVTSRPLPVASVGDVLVIEIAGAYGFVMASNYNSKPLPAEVLIDGGSPRLVRARQTPEDLIRGETV
ncbi:MAG: diaminopimelate decarboxylase [Planctomycetota bacterium]|jgi:diaminopimelate decarboxylase|nr:diaminopimelate decarboxylase [Planctomycetota bacterium]MDA1202177.1 diaminopimelate decarboxylase [Planctomycetota bacterium]